MCTYLAKRGATYYFRRIIPAELRAEMGGKSEFMISLRTKDRDEAKRRIPTFTIRTDELLESPRKTPRRRSGQPNAEPPLSRSEVTSRRMKEFEASRERYEEEAAAFFAAEESEKEHRRELAADAVAFLEQRLKGATASMPDELRAIAYLREHDVRIRRIAEEQRAIAQSEVARLTKELAGLGGAPKHDPTTGPDAAVPLLEVFDAYATVQGIKPQTRTDWRATIEKLVAFLGHDDAARITADDLDRWKDVLLSEITSKGTKREPRTVRNGYFTPVKATLNYAAETRKVPENVAEKVKVRVPRKSKLRDRDFSTGEARSILAATMAAPPPQLSAEQAFARRWVPWLCAYTGARVNEMSQLRKEDVLEIEGIPAIRITPEAGTVKANAARTVPLHSHLIEQGFLAAVLAKSDVLIL